MNDKLILSPISLDDLMNAIGNKIKEELSISAKNTDNKDQKEYLTRKKMAAKLNISLPTLSLYTKKGIIPSYRISGRVLYRQAEIADCLNKVITHRG